MKMKLNEFSQGDILIHKTGSRYRYEGWVHGSNGCYVLSTLDRFDSFIVTSDKLERDFIGKQEICSECGTQIRSRE